MNIDPDQNCPGTFNWNWDL